MSKLWLLALASVAACTVPRPVLFKASMAPPDHHLSPAGDVQKAAVRAALRKYYPQLDRTGRGLETVFFVTTTGGRVERTDLIRGAPPVGLEPEAVFWRFPDLRGEPGLRTGVTRFGPGEAGPAEIVVVWAEREVSSGARGPYRFANSAPEPR